MAISCTALLQDAAGEVGADPGNERLTARFVTAVNRTLDELSQRADLASPFSHISSTNGTIAIDAHYGWMIAAGIVYNLIRLGQRPSDPKIAAIIYADSAARWETAIGMYITAKLNADQATSTNNIIALGSVV